LTEAIRLDPKNSLGYKSRADVYFQKDEFDKAIFDVTEAIQLNPEVDFFDEGAPKPIEPWVTKRQLPPTKKKSKELAK
jgi:hypothetical protein